MFDDFSDNTLCVMVGLPRSGKTTIAKELCCRINAPIVCPDSVRLAIHGHSYIQSAEQYVWATVHTMISSLFISGHKYLILDSCNQNKNRRIAWKRFGCDLIFICMLTDRETCIKRASDNEPIIETIQRMSDSYESVSEDEGRTIILNGSSIEEDISTILCTVPTSENTRMERRWMP